MMRRIALALIIAVASVALPVAAATLGARWPHAIVDGFATKSGKGYWLLYADGSVKTSGDAHFYGDASALPLQGPIVGGTITPDGHGYWLVGMDGGIFSYGSARFFGSMGGVRLNQPVFSMASTLTGRGYWLVARDGGIFAFGNAGFYGSLGATRLNQPIIGITRGPTGRGYLMVARDGGVFGFGDARTFGSLPGSKLRVQDVVGLATTSTGKGYWIARADGSVYAYGDAHHFGNARVSPANPIRAIFQVPETSGYRLVAMNGATTAFGAPLPPSPTQPNPPATTTTTTVPPATTTTTTVPPPTPTPRPLPPAPAPTTTVPPATTTTTTTTTVPTTTTTTTTTTTVPATTTTTTVPTGTTTSTTTTTVPAQSTNCLTSDTTPHLCGFADLTNTGVLPGTSMTVITSSSRSGTNWSCNNPCTMFRITGNLGDATHGYELSDGICAQVGAANLTVTNFKVDGCHGAGAAAITVPNGSNNFTISNCDLIGAPDSTANVSSPLRAENGGILTIAGQSGVSVDHCHMHGFGTGGGLYIEQQRGAVVFTNNFVNHENCWDSTHNISCPQSDALYGSAYTDHTNAWHSGGGPGTSTTSSLLIRNNTLENDYTCCDQTTALSLFNDSGSLTQTNLNGLIDHNLFAAAGGFCMELQDPLGGSTVTYLKLKNNHYSRTLNPNCGSAGINFNSVNLNGHGVGDAQCANVWDDGPFAGSGADQNNSYPTKIQPVTPNTC